MKKLVALLLFAAPGCETVRVVAIDAEVSALVPAPVHVRVALKVER